MDNIRELLPFYALDVLDQRERAAVEAYLATDAAARDELAELHEATEHLLMTVEPLVPNPQVKRSLMERVEKSAAPIAVREPERQPRASFFQRALPALGLAFAAVAFIWAFSLLNSLNETQTRLTALEATTVALEAEVTQLEMQNFTLAQELAREVELMTVLTAVNSEQIAFGESDATHGLLTLNESAETAFLTVAGLDNLTDAQTYQFWLIDAGGASSAGTFGVDETGRGRLLIESSALQSFETLGISVEPAGGSESPTDVVFVEDL